MSEEKKPQAPDEESDKGAEYITPILLGILIMGAGVIVINSHFIEGIVVTLVGWILVVIGFIGTYRAWSKDMAPLDQRGEFH